MKLALLETPMTGFLAAWPRISTATGQILQVQQIIIFKTKAMRKIFIRYGPSSRENLFDGYPTK